MQRVVVHKVKNRCLPGENVVQMMKRGFDLLV